MLRELSSREIQILNTAVRHPSDLPENLKYLGWDKDSKIVQRLLDKISDIRDAKGRKDNVFVLSTMKDKLDLKEIV